MNNCHTVAFWTGILHSILLNQVCYKKSKVVYLVPVSTIFFSLRLMLDIPKPLWIVPNAMPNHINIPDQIPNTEAFSISKYSALLEIFITTYMIFENWAL